MPSTRYMYLPVVEAICIPFTKLLMEAFKSPAVRPLPPERRHVPEMAKQPEARSMPAAKVEVERLLRNMEPVPIFSCPCTFKLS